MTHVKEQKIKSKETLIGRLEAEVARLSAENEELRQLEALMDECSGNVSHELRTPLVTIIGYTEMLLNGDLGEIDARQRKSLVIIQRNAARIVDLINQILLSQRMGEPLVPSRLRPFPLKKLLEDIERNFKPSIREKGFQFSIALPDRPILVAGDRPRIERVFANLLSNAMKFTSSGGRIHIALSEPKDGKICVTLEDTGCGIPQEAQRYIFDRYRQTDGSVRRKFGGTGLGLAIVKRILQAHGVDIEVRSEVGKGSAFCFELPISEPNEESPDVDHGPSTDGIGAHDR